MPSFEHSGDADAQDELYKIRHSLAHVLAQAVLELRPGSTLGLARPLVMGSTMISFCRIQSLKKISRN